MCDKQKLQIMIDEIYSGIKSIYVEIQFKCVGYWRKAIFPSDTVLAASLWENSRKFIENLNWKILCVWRASIT